MKYNEYNGLVWSDELLDNGQQHTQNEWIELLKDTEWRLPSVRECESLLGCPDKKFMNKLKKDMKFNWLMTGNTLRNPFNGTERPVVLGLSSYNGFDVSAYDGDSAPARGVKKMISSNHTKTTRRKNND